MIWTVRNADVRIMENDASEPNGRITRYPVLLYVKGHVVVFGGGSVGLRKAASLARRGIDVCIIDRDNIECPVGIECIKADVDEASFKDYIDDTTSFVVCAFDDAPLNDTIANHCLRHSLPVNVATSSSGGTFAFPAILECGQELMAISSPDACPLCSYALKRYVVRELPNGSTFSRLMHRLHEDGVLDRMVVATILDDEKAMTYIREGRCEDALRHIREVIL